MTSKFGWLLGAGLLALSGVGAVVQNNVNLGGEASAGADAAVSSMMLTTVKGCAYDAASAGAVYRLRVSGRVNGGATIRVTTTMVDGTARELATGHSDVSVRGQFKESVRVVVPISAAKWSTGKRYCFNTWVARAR